MTNNPPKNDTPDKALVERATMAIKAVWQDYGLPVGPGLFEKMAEAALAAALSNSPVVGEDAPVPWTVRDGTDEDGIADGNAYDVLLPDGTWRGCIAVDPDDARQTIRAEWEAEQKARAAYKPTPTDTADRREAIAREIIARVVDRCRKLDDYANRRAWEKILSEEIQASLIAGPQSDKEVE